MARTKAATPNVWPLAPMTRNKEVPTLDASNNLQKWFIFPDQLPNQRFTGYQTRDNLSQNRGAFVVGQNVKMTLAQSPAPRDGYEVVGTEQSNATPVTRAWVYETRNGDQFEIKTYDTGVYYYLVGVSTEYALLKGGFTANLDFGYGNIGKSSDATSHTIFSNGTDGVYRFNGAYATVSGTTVNTISIATSTWTALGFYSTNTRSVIINGAEYAYTGGEGTTTLTGVTPDPTGLVNAGDLAVQSPQKLDGSGTLPDFSSIQGQVIMAHDGRLHMRSEAKKSIWQYSKLDDPFNFTTGSSDGDGGAKEVEFGGPIVAFGKINKTAEAFKSRMVKLLDFIQVGARIDSPRYQTLVSVDDKGTTLGATNQKSTFSAPSGLIFVTPDKRMVLLTGVTANNEPQYVFLSDPIQQVFQQGVHDTGTGICVDNEIWYSFKQNINSTFNDVEIHGNMLRQTFDNYNRPLPIQWDTPTIGKFVSDYTVIYNGATGKNEIHWHSAINSNTYRTIPDKTDNTTAFTTIVRTWQETFGVQNQQKRIDRCFVEIFMLENTELEIAILYDEDGITGRQLYTIKGSSIVNSFGTSPFNPHGASPFGWQRIGSNPDESALALYRFDLEINPNIYFFNISMQISGGTENNNYELVRFGYRLMEVTDDIDLRYKIGITS